MDNIKGKFDRLAEGCDMIIAPFASRDELDRRGLHCQVVPAKTIDELFAERQGLASEVIRQLPPIPEDLDLPHAIKCLYQEILECILFGLNGAAITLCGNLIEFVLKHVTFIREQGGYQNYDSDKWDAFEEMDLFNAIGRAKKQGLLESRRARRLSEFRQDIRNPYSHYNIRKITHHMVAGGVKVMDLASGESEIRDIEAKDDPAIQAVAKPWVDKQNVLRVFYFTDEVLRYLVTKLGELENAAQKVDEE